MRGLRTGILKEVLLPSLVRLPPSIPAGGWPKDSLLLGSSALLLNVPCERCWEWGGVLDPSSRTEGGMKPTQQEFCPLCWRGIHTVLSGPWRLSCQEVQQGSVFNSAHVCYSKEESCSGGRGAVCFRGVLKVTLVFSDCSSPKEYNWAVKSSNGGVSRWVGAVAQGPKADGHKTGIGFKKLGERLFSLHQCCCSRFPLRPSDSFLQWNCLR